MEIRNHDDLPSEKQRLEENGRPPDSGIEIEDIDEENDVYLFYPSFWPLK